MCTIYMYFYNRIASIDVLYKLWCRSKQRCASTQLDVQTSLTDDAAKSSRARELTLSMTKSKTLSSTTWPEGHSQISLTALLLSDSALSVNKQGKWWWCQDAIMFIFVFIQLYSLILSLRKGFNDILMIFNGNSVRLVCYHARKLDRTLWTTHRRLCVSQLLRLIQEKQHPVNLTERQTSPRMTPKKIPQPFVEPGLNFWLVRHSFWHQQIWVCFLVSVCT